MIDADSYTVQQAPWDAIAGTDYVNPPMALYVGDTLKTFLKVGSSDHTEVFRDEKYIYVVGENTRLDYASLQVFDAETYEEEFEIFIDGEDYDNDNISDMSMEQIRDHLLQWWQ